MGSTHTWDGVNYADAFHISMTIIGLFCLLVGTGLVIKCNHRRTDPSCEIGPVALSPGETPDKIKPAHVSGAQAAGPD